MAFMKQIARDQFPDIDLLTTYPEMHSLCRIYCFRIDLWRRTIFCMTAKMRYFHENLTFLEDRQDAFRKPLGCPVNIVVCV